MKAINEKLVITLISIIIISAALLTAIISWNQIPTY